MISQSTIDKIFSTVRVEEIIGEYVQLKKVGANYKGLSPFKDEKSPSFVVSPSKQMWKDFSSGKGGNVISFLKEVENFTYPEALRFLAKKYGIEVEEDRQEFTEEQLQAKTKKELLYKIHEVANHWFQEQLWESEEGRAVALSYFRHRDISEESIKKFQLGYSPEQKSAFAAYAAEQGYEKEILEASGLVLFPEYAPIGIDRFRERVMFPIMSFSGRVLGFGGRILASQAKTAKYVNSPETDIYHKSSVLYGLAQSRQAISKLDECLLVEGYMDVIALHQAGIENVVASSGTALTQEQIKLIKRLTTHITILFDGDEAGIKASFRSIDLLLAEGMSTRVVLFPDGHDPDSFRRGKSEEEIRTFLKENAKDFVEFKSEILLRNTGDDPIKKAEAIRDIVSSVSKIPSPLQREIYIQKIATSFGLSEQNLANELGIQKQEIQGKKSFDIVKAKPALQSIAEIEEVNPILILEEKLIELLLKYGSKIISLTDADGEPYNISIIEEVLEYFEEMEYEPLSAINTHILEEVTLALKENPDLGEDFFYRLMDEDISEKLADISVDKYTLSNWDQFDIHLRKEEELLDKILQEVINRHRRELIIKKIRDIQKKSKEQELEISDYQLIKKLTELKNKIDGEMFRPM